MLRSWEFILVYENTLHAVRGIGTLCCTRLIFINFVGCIYTTPYKLCKEGMYY
jgi:hypothetical protein